MIVLKELSELIQACKDIKKRMPLEHERDHMIHVDDIAATLQKIIDDEFARANRTFDQAVIEEVIEAQDPKPAKTGFRPSEDGSTIEDWEEWGQELAQLRAAHIENAKLSKTPRRKESSRRADRLNQSPKTDKGNA